MVWIYQISIWLYGKVVYFLSFSNVKAKSFITGRKAQLITIKHLPRKKNYRFWIHAASLGEFEQGRPVIESLKTKYPDSEVILTFFSPSGYEVKKDYELANHVLYLPLDSAKNAKCFVEAIDPDLAIFVKYEFWYFYLIELQRRKSPTIFISSVFREDQLYFHFTGGFMRRALKGVNHFFVQDESSKELLETIDIAHVTIAGDTRLDRVVSLAEKRLQYPMVDQFAAGKPLFILGSTWPSDMEVCHQFVLSNIGKYKFIIAPHNITKAAIDKLLEFPQSFKYSDKPKNVEVYDIMIIDSFGLLSSLYGYAHIAYVGGGFNGTLHNTMEAAVYGIPVVWGRHINNTKFLEASGLLVENGGFEIANAEELNVTFQFLEEESNYEASATAAKKYVYERTGATKKIMNHISTIV